MVMFTGSTATPAPKAKSLPSLTPSPPLECIFGYIPFLRRWDTVRYSGIQLDTARYVRIQLDTVAVEYSGIRADTVDLLQNG